MNFMVWRLHRNQVYFAAAALVALTVLLLITGTVMAHDYHRFLEVCGGSQGCFSDRPFRGDGAIMDLVNLTVVVPLLFGLFWGAPMLAKEFEDGTHNLAWTQGVTRRQWFATNIGWVLVAAAVWGAAMAALVSWWRYPENAMGSRFDAFDIQGIVPVAYALFAVVLGIAVGSVLRRVLPAIALTLGLFVAVRVPFAVYLRPHLLAPVTKIYPLQSAGPPPGAWTIDSNIVSPNGQILQGPGSLQGACQSAAEGKGGGSSFPACLSAHGYHQLATFQPASRFWAFQGIEAGIFIALTMALLTFAWWRVQTQDA